ncbi:uncharacterized protein Dsimw501_GD18905 [Drosophila simulans]|uniref:GD18905 n=2 Tax=Drosophila simulans TaxID=7240 RepID=B4R1A1_DROSI|nr:GD18905 [Drosophila simulans]KMZ03813.1 uncharacterized protein Dsimw501_GD18905 [Drosophila simulans]
MFFGLIGYFLLMLQIILVPYSNGAGCQFECVNQNKCHGIRKKNMVGLGRCGINKVCCPKGETYLPHNTCGQSRIKSTMGKIPALNEFPWMAMLLYGNKNNLSEKLVPKCGGSLINNWYVLTAAHCVDKPFMENEFVLKNVRLGEHNTSTNPDRTIVNGISQYAPDYMEIEVDQILSHANFNVGWHMINDIALVRLKFPVGYTRAIQPICIPTPQKVLAHKRKFQTAGWPEMEPGISSEVLLRSFIAERHPDVCSRTNYDFNFESQICAGGLDGNRTSPGDSGGPLMETVISGNVAITYAAGIISYGQKTYMPEFHTNNLFFWEWINSKIRSAFIDSYQ